MRYRKMDSAGDMQFGAGQADFYRDQPEAPAQAVLTRLRLWMGEWFIDVTEGTPYQQAILGKHTGTTVEPAIRKRILETEGVTSIESFSLSTDPDTRKTTVAAIVNTEYGTAILNEIF